MNHLDFMQSKTKRSVDMIDYVKNTGKPRRNKSRYNRGTSQQSGRGGNMPAINLYFMTGGREVLYNTTQPFPYNPQNLPVNIQNAQPNPLAVQGYNAQQRVDLTELRNQQAQINQSIIDLRDRINAQAMNPPMQQQLQQQIQASQQQNAQLLQAVQDHNRNISDGLNINRRETNRLRDQLEVGNRIAFHNAIQTLSVGQGYKRATQEELVRDLENQQLTTAQQRLLEAMDKQLHNAEPSRGRGQQARRSEPPQERQSSPPAARGGSRQAGVGASSSEDAIEGQGWGREAGGQAVYMSSRPSTSGARPFRTPTQLPTTTELPTTEFSSRGSAGRQQNQLDMQRLAQRYENAELGLTESEVEAYLPRSAYNIFSDIDAQH